MAPTATIAYGPHAEQVADLWLPLGEGPHPGVVLVHGGCWRAEYGRELEDRLAADLAFAGARRVEPRVSEARLRWRLARPTR